MLSISAPVSGPVVFSGAGLEQAASSSAPAAAAAPAWTSRAGEGRGMVRLSSGVDAVDRKRARWPSLRRRAAAKTSRSAEAGRWAANIRRAAETAGMVDASIRVDAAVRRTKAGEIAKA